MHTVKERWGEIIDYLRTEHELSNVSFNTWILPLKVFDVIDETVIILVNSNANAEYIEKKYMLPLKVCIGEITGVEYEILFLSEDDERLENPESLLHETTHKRRSKSIFDKIGLNSKYTFETFVVGGNNKFAYSVANAVVNSPGKVYNPLFLYGGVGLGKTHLMHSIAHKILVDHPESKVLYITSETFTNELIDAIKNQNQRVNREESSLNAFRKKYRDNDILLIDDIQFIIGKESTQEEFFHTFEHLHLYGKQIVISSDKPPKDLETLEARLKTRFEQGCIADISAPDYETRMAILQKKIDNDHLEKYHIPQDVLHYIATHIKTNIRELEGSLNKIIALYKLNNTNEEMDISLAVEALKDFIVSGDKKEITPDLIVDTVADHYNISVADIKSEKRPAEIAVPRQIAMYLIRTLTEVPLKSIGIAVGGKDHSTVKHGIDKITKQLSKDEKLQNTINIIKKKIVPA
ncbi:MAG: chromosomal replication initiator protein DnaA [Lachnospiraceae bacterium]|nr:chromosomal replication initiator protein DnaA [Lachnospiraceae bacterium]